MEEGTEARGVGRTKGVFVCCIALACCGAAGAEEPVDALLREIVSSRARAGESSTSAGRLAAAEELLEARGRLIRGHADDARLPVWLADQASDLYFILLDVDATGLTCRFGLPDAAQRARAARVALEMDENVLQARAAIERALAAEGQPRGEAALAWREELEAERDLRIPFLAGVGALLRAELAPDPAIRRGGCLVAADLLRPLARRLPPRLAATAEIYAGLALLGAGDLDEAEALLRRAAGEPALDERDAIAASLGLVSVATRGQGPAAGLEALAELKRRAGAGDVLLRLLIADQQFLLLRENARQAQSPAREALLAEAFAPYLELDRSAEGPGAEPLHQAVLDRLAAAADAETPLLRLPPLVSLGRARGLAGDEATRGEAVALCRDLLSDDPDERDRVDALWTLGTALLQDGRLAEGAEALTQLARDHPTAPTAERAVERPAAAAAAHANSGRGDPEAIDLLRRTLDLLLERYPNIASIDRWHYARATLALDAGELQDAIARFGRITRDAPEWRDAQVDRVRAACRWAEAQQTPAQRDRACAELLELADAAKRDLAGGDPRQAAELALFAARARLGLGEPERALSLLSEQDAGGTEVRLVRIEAMEALDRDAEAAVAIGDLAASGDVPAGAMLAEMLRERRRQVEALLDDGSAEEAADLARRRLVPVAEALQVWSAGATSETETAVLLSVAGAYLLAERFDAARSIYDRLLAAHPNGAEALLGRAECLYGAGDAGPEAMSLYRRIASGADRGTDAWWRSHMRMLQILSLAGRNTHRIAPYIEKLREEDPELGGERYRREFERLQRKHRSQS